MSAEELESELTPYLDSTRRNQRLVRGAALGLLAAGILMFVLHHDRRTIGLILSAPLIVLSALAIWGSYKMGREADRLLYVLREAQPIPADLILELKTEVPTDPDLYARVLLHTHADGKDVSPTIVLKPEWEYRHLLERSIHCEAFIDPGTGKWAVIRTPYGLIVR
jgi:hypothetical protein